MGVLRDAGMRRLRPELDEEPESGVRPRPVLPTPAPSADGSSGPSALVEVVAPCKTNRLHAGYVALLQIGIKVVRTEVRAVGSYVLQRLYLREADDCAPSPARVSEARAALCSVHGVGHLLERSSAASSRRAKVLRTDTAFPGATKWPK